MKTTLLSVALVAAGVAAVTVAQAQPAPPPPPGPAPTATTDPNAPPAPAPGAPGSAAPAPTPAPTATTTATADPGAPPAPPGAPGAQPADPNAPPAPPPPAPPPVAPPPAAPQTAPTALPPAFTPPPVPIVNWGAPPTGGDTATPTNKPAPLRWRGSSVSWSNTASTTMFNVGYNPPNDPEKPLTRGHEDDVYEMGFSFAPNFYLVDEKNDKVTASLRLGADVELTHSDATYQNELFFRDMNLGVRYTRTLLKAPVDTPEYITAASLGLSFSLPTSKASFNSGKYMTITLNPTVRQQIKLLGSESSLFPNVSLTAGLTYGHLFSRAKVPTSTLPNITNRARAVGTDVPENALTTDQTDQLRGAAFAADTLTPSVQLDIPIYDALELSAAYRHTINFKYDLTTGDDQVCLLTGCENLADESNPTTFYVSTFDISLGYTFFDVVSASVGYNNTAGALGPDGRNHAERAFFAPGASTFYLEIGVSLDALYSKATNRDKKVALAGQSSWF